jgi:hypothetical protein
VRHLPVFFPFCTRPNLHRPEPPFPAFEPAGTMQAMDPYVKPGFSLPLAVRAFFFETQRMIQTLET